MLAGRDPLACVAYVGPFNVELGIELVCPPHAAMDSAPMATVTLAIASRTINTPEARGKA
jgi:hypothetical protein